MMHKKDSFQTRNDNILLIVILGGILFVSPILGFFLSLFCFRQKAALLLFVLFSFYFGWFYEPQMDLLNHYNHFKTLIGKSLGEAWVNPETIHLGKEPYPVLFKYVVGQISDSPHFFSACACTVYSVLFIYGVLGSISDIYRQEMPMSAWMSFLGIIFVVEYNWFLGLRFWSGAFVFVAFYIRYARTRNKKYLFLSSLCICFHFSLLALCVAVALNHILKDNLKLRYILVGISMVIRFLQIPLATIIAKMNLMDGIVKEAYRNDEVIKSVAKRMAYFRSQGNQYYMLRNEILLIGLALVIIFFWKRYGNAFLRENSKLWGICLILFAFANFGYTDLTFYDRFLKVTLLLLYILVYMWIMKKKSDLDMAAQFWIILFSCFPAMYAIATIAISQRQHLWHIDLWFNNFLISFLN